jgi:hypothetical protein
VDPQEDEFYARVDEVRSPTELIVTILDIWKPMDKLQGDRWPNGAAKVKPTRRIIVLEETAVPNDPNVVNEAVAFLKKAIRNSNHEIICSGSNVSVRKEPEGETICVVGYVFVKNGLTLNNALVCRGLATTTNPFYQSLQHEAKRKKLGMWRERNP